MRLGKSDEERQAAVERREREQERLSSFNAERSEYSGDRWDYHVEVITHSMGFRGDKLKVSDLEKRLDELGRQGFELAAARWDADLSGQRDGHMLIFKRRIKV